MRLPLSVSPFYGAFISVIVTTDILRGAPEFHCGLSFTLVLQVKQQICCIKEKSKPVCRQTSFINRNIFQNLVKILY